MRLKSIISLLLVFVFAFAFAAFTSPPTKAANNNVKIQKTVQSGSTVAVEKSAVLPQAARENVIRKFYGVIISRAAGKVPVEGLNINAIGRFAPDFVPLN